MTNSKDVFQRIINFLLKKEVQFVPPKKYKNAIKHLIKNDL